MFVSYINNKRRYGIWYSKRNYIALTINKMSHSSFHKSSEKLNVKTIHQTWVYRKSKGPISALKSYIQFFFFTCHESPVQTKSMDGTTFPKVYTIYDSIQFYLGIYHQMLAIWMEISNMPPSSGAHTREYHILCTVHTIHNIPPQRGSLYQCIMHSNCFGLNC